MSPMRDADNPPTAAELAARSSSGSLVCPKCGCAHMEPSKSRTHANGVVHLYRICRNPNCGARFEVRREQTPTETVIREVKPRNLSNVGQHELKLLRDSA